MDIIYNDVFLQHDTGMHPENKKRLEAFNEIPQTEIPHSEDYLEIVHTKEYIQRVKDSCNPGGHLDQDTVVSPRSFEAAVKAVNATVMASENGDFALVRPPGHHAYPGHSSGFCLFNNVAIATQKLVNENQKVLIFDFDGHLGDGTSKIFNSTDKVMYWSLHQYPAFPGGGNADEIGEGNGNGFTINVPLPSTGGDDIYLEAVKRFMPIALQFDPDVVAISAGFDSHQYDLLLDLRLTMNAYYETGKILRDNFKRMFATLEGGYNVEILHKCVTNFLNGINGEKMTYEERGTDSRIMTIDEFEHRMDALDRNLKPYWNI